MGRRAAQAAGPATLRLDGDLDLTTVERCEEKIERAAEDAGAGLIVDLSELRFIDTAGVAMLFREASKMAAQRRRLAYVAPAASIAGRVLAIASLPLNESVTDAHRELAPRRRS